MTLANFSNNNSKPTPNPMNSTHRTAIVAGCFLLLVLVVAIVYSRHARNEQISSASTTPIASAPLPPTTAAAVETPALAPKTKKAVRKRSSVVTYNNRTYGVSFRYPRKYILKTGDEQHLDVAGLGPVEMNFVQPGGISVAAVELPRGSYAGSDLSSAFLNVSVNSKMTASECSQFSLPTVERHEVEAVPSSKLIVGDLEFDVMEDHAGGAMKDADIKYFHTFQNGACYEFALGVGTASEEAKDNSVNPEPIFLKLEKVLATVKINSEAAPEVSARTAVQNEEGNSARAAVHTEDGNNR
jgi:hypothetical protein